jgi:fructokinase
VNDLVLVAGEALYDIVVGDGDALHAHPGGGPFNTARTIARLEQPVAYLGRISTDRFGRTLERMLASDRVRLDSVVHTDDPTTLAIAEMDSTGGGAEYRFYQRGTSAPGLTPEAALAALPDDVGILHVGSLGLTLEPIATAVEAVVQSLAQRSMVAVDPNCRPAAIDDPAGYRERLRRVLRLSHLVKLSEDDLAWLEPRRPPVDAARALLELGPAVVLLTRGARGAVIVTGEGEIAVPAPPAKVVDTIGAGDAFGGGFLAWWRSHGHGHGALADRDLVIEATRFAALVAARTCERAGASPPRLGELEPGALEGS